MELPFDFLMSLGYRHIHRDKYRRQIPDSTQAPSKDAEQGTVYEAYICSLLLHLVVAVLEINGPAKAARKFFWGKL